LIASFDSFKKRMSERDAQASRKVFQPVVANGSQRQAASATSSEKGAYISEAIQQQGEEICFEEFRAIRMNHVKPCPVFHAITPVNRSKVQL
jgi:hypothetical protein